LTDEPLRKSIPRPPADFPYGVRFPNDSTHQPVTFTRPQPTTGPDAGFKVQPHPPAGFTATPVTGIGATGAHPDEPTKGKLFGSPMDARQWYPEPGFQRPMGGPGTAPNDKAPFSPPELGQSVTIKGPPGSNTPSGRGLRDQPDLPLGSRGSGSIAGPQEYHPQISTATTLAGRRRYFK